MYIILIGPLPLRSRKKQRNCVSPLDETTKTQAPSHNKPLPAPKHTPGGGQIFSYQSYKALNKFVVLNLTHNLKGYRNVC